MGKAYSMRVDLIGKLVLGTVLLLFLLLSCNASNLGGKDNWKIYHNSRYGFEFPYPSNWEQSPMPDNGDGGAFRDPKNPSVEIRGWAVHQLSKNQKSSAKKSNKNHPKSQQENFMTQQGISGKLQVEIGPDISFMTLRLSKNKVQYNWQAQGNSKQFADYYRLFYYIASQYRLPSDKKQ